MKKERIFFITGAKQKIPYANPKEGLFPGEICGIPFAARENCATINKNRRNACREKDYEELEERIIAQAGYIRIILSAWTAFGSSTGYWPAGPHRRGVLPDFSGRGINKIVTVEASGIAYACMTARYFRCSRGLCQRRRGSIEGGLY